jgi:hypothetical protein
LQTQTHRYCDVQLSIYRGYPATTGHLQASSDNVFVSDGLFWPKWLSVYMVAVGDFVKGKFELVVVARDGRPQAKPPSLPVFQISLAV